MRLARRKLVLRGQGGLDLFSKGSWGVVGRATDRDETDSPER